MTYAECIRQQFPCPEGYTELVYPKVGDMVYGRLTCIPYRIVEIRGNRLCTIGAAGSSEDNAIWYIRKA